MDILIYLLDNQPHDFSDKSSNICEILHKVIIKMIQIIKNSNISVKVKQNRINFFATIR